jgi:mRNA-degrading endonuclease RelE of RelBE toxin-antitoxin system
MRVQVILVPEAMEDFKQLKAHVRAEVRDAIERHLLHEPRKTTKSRIKRLRGFSKPQYRLRVGEVRIFYDVSEDSAAVLAIVSKSGAGTWLKGAGELQ